MATGGPFHPPTSYGNNAAAASQLDWHNPATLGNMGQTADEQAATVPAFHGSPSLELTYASAEYTPLPPSPITCDSEQKRYKSSPINQQPDEYRLDAHGDISTNANDNTSPAMEWLANR